MAYLTAESILSADDFVYADVDCPEWGGTVRVRSLSGAQRVTIKKAIDNGAQDVDEMVCVMAAVDADGKRIFERKHIDALSRKNTAPVTRCAVRVLEISGMRDPKKSIEDAEKNSGMTESGDSSFD